VLMSLSDNFTAFKKRDVPSDLDDLYNEAKDLDIKLNYRCPKGTYDDGFACGLDKTTKKDQLGKISDSIKKVVGATDVKLTGIQPRDAKIILDTLEKESKYIPIRLESIINTVARKSGGTMMINRERSRNGEMKYTLGISPKQMNDKNIFDRRSYSAMINNYRNLAASYNKQASTVPDSKSDLKRSILVYAAKAELEAKLLEKHRDEGKPYVPETVSSMFPPGAKQVEATTLHECGHYRWFSSLNNDDKTAVNNAYRNAEKDDFPSSRSKMNSGEWFAENYALFRLGMKADPIVEKIMKSKKG